MPQSRALVTAIRSELRSLADPAKAEPMRAYMKSTMPYLGVPMPLMRRTCKALFKAHAVPDAATWRETVLHLWRRASHREERYAAVELTDHRPYRAWIDLDALPMFEEMIVTGAWWDFVDVIAAHRIGVLLQNHPREMKPLLRRWARDPDMWRRRTAILAQLAFKEKTDLALLHGCMEPNFADPEFFIRKAIGWALRQYAWTDPEEVRRYVREYEARLSPLSRREALKNL
ncbi:MAG: DNA alkylation repair protein [Candidatus Eisenbacteria bacterium]